jgi:hypothetical protein
VDPLLLGIVAAPARQPELRVGAKGEVFAVFHLGEVPSPAAAQGYRDAIRQRGLVGASDSAKQFTAFAVEPGPVLVYRRFDWTGEPVPDPLGHAWHSHPEERVVEVDGRDLVVRLSRPDPQGWRRFSLVPDSDQGVIDDLPVSRFPGSVVTSVARDGADLTVGFAVRSSLGAVLDHYEGALREGGLVPERKAKGLIWKGPPWRGGVALTIWEPAPPDLPGTSVTLDDLAYRAPEISQRLGVARYEVRLQAAPHVLGGP